MVERKILNSFNPELELKYTESATKSKQKDLLSELKGFQFTKSLFSKFKKMQDNDKTLYKTFYSNSKAETTIN